MTRFPKMLLLSRSVPPAPTGSAVIVGNLAQQFNRDEMVIAGAYCMGAPDVEWPAGAPLLIYANLQLPSHWRGARLFRWIQWPWLLVRALWLLIAHRCQAIMVVFPDECFLLAGYLLAVVTGKPLYAYFHNTFKELRPRSSFARWLQPRVFARAEHVFVMSEGMQELYRDKYPALSCSPLLHSFNEPLAEIAEVVLPAPSNPLRLVLFGNVNASNAEAARRIAEVVQGRSDIHLAVYSGSSRSYLDSLGFNGERVTIETVSRELLLERLKDADIIVLPHGFYGLSPDEEIATIFPTRTIEALISERPILAHCPRDCFLSRFLSRHDCAIVVHDPRVDAIADALEKLRSDPELRLHLVRQALVAARQFQAEIVARHLRSTAQNGAAIRTEPDVLHNR